ncbi:hypothetical protein BDV11DRAFT_44429 [Aspergillus similis]
MPLRLYFLGMLQLWVLPKAGRPDREAVLTAWYRTRMIYWVLGLSRSALHRLIYARERDDGLKTPPGSPIRLEPELPQLSPQLQSGRSCGSRPLLEARDRERGKSQGMPQRVKNKEYSYGFLSCSSRATDAELHCIAVS